MQPLVGHFYRSFFITLTSIRHIIVVYRYTTQRLSLYRQRIESTRMRKLEHCASCLPQTSIVGYSLCCNEASTELQYKLRFPGKEEESIVRYV